MRNQDIQEMFRAIGLPPKDLHRHPRSRKRFPDGADWRTEISGIENLAVLKAVIEAAKHWQVPLHRLISVVRGSDKFPVSELKEFAAIAAGEGIEVVITPGPRPTDFIGRQVATPEGIISGLGLRGVDANSYYFEDVMRSYEIGFRAFLVWDVGVLNALNQLRKIGKIPNDVIFKWSIFGGCTWPGTAQLLESLGADTINPVADLSIAELAAIRAVLDKKTAMDVHIRLWKSMGKYNRIYEAWKIAWVAAPVYFKMESGTGLAMYDQTTPDTVLIEAAWNKVESLHVIRERIQENEPSLKLSDARPDDLHIPKPKG